MKRYIILSLLLFSLSTFTFAQKNSNAWKSAKNLQQQYIVLKENLNYWNGSYFLSEKQLNEFYNALTDSIAVLKNKISDKTKTVNKLQNEIDSSNKLLENTKAELNSSIKNQNAIDVFGENIDKRMYSLFMYIVILALLMFLGILFLLYKRSNKITVRTQKEYKEIKEEFEMHKKNTLERYTKINMELHHTRLELNKK